VDGRGRFIISRAIGQTLTGTSIFRWHSMTTTCHLSYLYSMNILCGLVSRFLSLMLCPPARWPCYDTYFFTFPMCAQPARPDDATAPNKTAQTDALCYNYCTSAFRQSCADIITAQVQWINKCCFDFARERTDENWAFSLLTANRYGNYIFERRLCGLFSWLRDLISWLRGLINWLCGLISWLRDLISWRRGLNSWLHDLISWLLLKGWRVLNNTYPYCFILRRRQFFSCCSTTANK
jgi:hypothetical protein